MSFPLSQSASVPESRGDIARGLLTGVVPLAVLAAIVGLALLLALWTRQAFATAGFFVEQRATLIVLVSGLVLALIAYGLAIWLAMRRVARWLQDARVLRARAALWMLAGTALISVLPVIIALLLPQHPAP